VRRGSHEPPRSPSPHTARLTPEGRGAAPPSTGEDQTPDQQQPHLRHLDMRSNMAQIDRPIYPDDNRPSFGERQRGAREQLIPG
jgi:hypothetical protein